jgi:hypothetical protein
MQDHRILLTIVFAVAATPALSRAKTVTPMIGGGQASASMVHVGVFYDYTMNCMSVDVDTSLPMPEMRPLAPGDEFDPAQPWSILSGKAYNFQYGWIASGYFLLPEGTAVWVELLSQSPGLETYRGNKDKGGYLPIFGTAGSSLRWKWPGVMTHNTYAVLSPDEAIYWATYRVYFGDAATGDPIPGYDCETVTLRLAVRSEPQRAWDPLPPNGTAADAEQVVPLTWRPGESGIQHDVYLGTDMNAVANADTSDTIGIYHGRQVLDANDYSAEDLEWGQTYYWRIDEVGNDMTLAKGMVWSFTVTDFLLVDDFEQYDKCCHKVSSTWRNGAGQPAMPDGTMSPATGNASTAGPIPPDGSSVDDAVFHSGRQSMSWTYDGTTTPLSAEIYREWATPQDWSRQGVKTLSMWFRGQHDNRAGLLRVKIQDAAGASAVVRYDDLDVARLDSWWQWNIDLVGLREAGVNVAAIRKIAIGVGDGLTLQPGNKGTLHLDDVRLYRPRSLTSVLR